MSVFLVWPCEGTRCRSLEPLSVADHRHTSKGKGSQFPGQAAGVTMFSAPLLLVQAPGELIVFTAVADEARLVLNRLHRPDERRQVGDKILRDAAAAQELFGDLPLGLVERVHTDAARSQMSDGFQPFDLRKVHVGEARATHPCIFNTYFVQLGPGQARPTQVGPAQVGKAEVGPAQVGKAEVGNAKVRVDEFESDRRVLLAPRSDRRRALLDDLDVFWIGHVGLREDKRRAEGRQPARRIASWPLRGCEF